MSERVITKEETEALAYANSSPKQEHSAPRKVENPGLYFGYLAAARSAKKRYDYLEEQITLQASIFQNLIEEARKERDYYKGLLEVEKKKG